MRTLPSTDDTSLTKASDSNTEAAADAQKELRALRDLLPRPFDAYQDALHEIDPVVILLR
jgi:hypothetical protein